MDLERNDFRKVYYRSGKKKLILRLTVGSDFSYEIFPVERYEEANEKTRLAEEQGKQSGKELGITNPEEDTARRLWMRFVQDQEKQGLKVRSLVDVVLGAIENEKKKEITPLFSDVAFQFWEHKEKIANWGEE